MEKAESFTGSPESTHKKQEAPKVAEAPEKAERKAPAKLSTAVPATLTVDHAFAEQMSSARWKELGANPSLIGQDTSLALLQRSLGTSSLQGQQGVELRKSTRHVFEGVDALAKEDFEIAKNIASKLASFGVGDASAGANIENPLFDFEALRTSLERNKAQAQLNMARAPDEDQKRHSDIVERYDVLLQQLDLREKRNVASDRQRSFSFNRVLLSELRRLSK